MPVVVLTGARQTGKSTLVQGLLPGPRDYYSLDDLEIRDLARHDPDALLKGKRPVTLDEVQHVPELMLAIKRAVDAHREPGRFLLTGSANLLLMRRVSESLAGRSSHLVLRPLTRSEQLGLGRCGLWEELLETPQEQWLDLLQAGARQREDWRALARRGGFPTPALHLEDAEARRIWFDGYVRTYLERDLRELSAISGLPEFRRLMQAAAHRTGQLLNQSELGRDTGIPQPTVHRYLNLLEISYLLVRLPPYARNRTKRIVKSPKLYWGDTGLALHLGRESVPGGQHLENFILTDLLAWCDSQPAQRELFFWRTHTGQEVDFVIEADQTLLPIEVKSTSRPRLADARHLLSFQQEYGDSARAALLLHTGDELKWLSPGVLAAPWWRVL